MKSRISKQLARLKTLYPEVIADYWVSIEKRVDHFISLKPGWQCPYISTQKHLFSQHTVQDMLFLWENVQPCNCNKCTRANISNTSPSALTIYRCYDWLPIPHPGCSISSLILRAIKKDWHIPGYADLSTLSDTDQVAVDEYLMQYQK